MPLRLLALFRPVVPISLVLLALLGSRLSTAAHAEPTRVEAGVLFTTIYDIDFVDGSFGSDFYVWWISPDPAFQPFDVMQILNGRQWTARAVSKRQLPDGRWHTSGVVSATINHKWRLRRFPFDEQTLRIIIETPSPASEFKIVPDWKNTSLADLMHVQGFEVSDLRVKESVERYSTNFGMQDDAAREFSRLVVELDLKRKSGRFVTSFLIGFIAANIIALLTFAIHVSELSIRASMVGSAIFAAIGNMYYMNTALNPAAGSILIDMFTVISFAVIIVALLNSILVERLIKRGKSSLAHRVNRNSFYFISVVAAVAYTATMVAVLTSD